MNFCMVLSMYPVMGATGLIIWLMGSALLPWLIHFSMAAAMMPLIGGHIFMATINPASRVGLSGMFSGMVDRAWASHHYRRWFKENFDAARRASARRARGADADLVQDRGAFQVGVSRRGAPRASSATRPSGDAGGPRGGDVRHPPFAARAMVSNLAVSVEKTTAVLLVESPLLTRPVSDASVVPGNLGKATKVIRFATSAPTRSCKIPRAAQATCSPPRSDLSLLPSPSNREAPGGDARGAADDARDRRRRLRAGEL